MKTFTKNAVNRVYTLLALKAENPLEHEWQIEFGARHTPRWDHPEISKTRASGLVQSFRNADAES
jgi:hypothetical protein